MPVAEDQFQVEVLLGEESSVGQCAYVYLLATQYRAIVTMPAAIVNQEQIDLVQIRDAVADWVTAGCAKGALLPVLLVDRDHPKVQTLFMGEAYHLLPAPQTIVGFATAAGHAATGMGRDECAAAVKSLWLVLVALAADAWPESGWKAELAKLPVAPPEWITPERMTDVS